MTDRTILFSGPMIRAILREIREPGTGKTVTRRVIKPPRGEYPRFCSLFNGEWTDDYVLDPGNAEWRQRDVRYEPGDRLWVRESCAIHYGGRNLGEDDAVFYRATDPDEAGPWRPSIHMPRWASRITLHVTDVRVERLQDITEDEARREGAECLVMDDDGRFFQSDKGNYRIGFAGLWEHLNGKRGFGWDTNPWVAAISFRPELRNIDEVRG